MLNDLTATVQHTIRNDLQAFQEWLTAIENSLRNTLATSGAFAPVRVTAATAVSYSEETTTGGLP